ncbi:hypothetical protein KCP77_15060 [Salmonella enterica subsp. enterica]|nr:hypothetical protein KCP77_15060 [Salmonella enterica subsp. enterica]
MSNRRANAPNARMIVIDPRYNASPPPAAKTSGCRFAQYRWRAGGGNGCADYRRSY